MEYYLEFKAKPTEDLAPEIIISQVFSLCHLEIVKMKAEDIGISFPQAEKSLGGMMRVHGKRQQLDLIAKSCRRLLDYCQINPCAETPGDSGWCLIKRVQPGMSAAKIRRLLKRGSITDKEAAERLENPIELTYPYIQLRSSSTRQSFRIFISQRTTEAPQQAPQFNSYGLGGLVPWF